MLQGAPAADDAFDDLRRPNVVQDTVEVEPHPVEDTEAERVGETAPWPQADVDAVTREAPLVLGGGGVRGMLEPDDVRLRLV
jgi:hypothetical protein